VNYYNEIDDKAAAWLRELVSQKLIPAGDVDTRSITEVKAHELKGYTQCHFFAGIAGWPLALQLAGWPADRPVWTGSCPCQPFSTAGKGLAQKDERHLWPAFFDLIRQCRPEQVFGEQVASAIGHGWLDGVSADLEAEGYACGATVLGAHSVQSPHQRQRLYWVAHSGSTGGGSLRSDPLERDGRSAQIREAEGPDGLVQGCAPDGVADSTSIRCEQQRGGSTAEIQGGCAERARQQPQPEHSGELSGGFEGLCGVGGRMADSKHKGPQGYRGFGEESIQEGRERTQRHSAESGAAGFWSDFQLVHCRDGKTRRVPTEPLLQRVANGIPLAVDHLRHIVGELETQIAHYAKKTNGTTLEAVREMQHAFWSEAIQWDARGRIGILSPEILLAALCQLERELGGVLNSSPQSIIEAQREILFRVREYSTKEATACPSQGRRYAQQFARELADALHELPHEDSLEAAQGVFDRAGGFPLTSKCPARTTLLRGYGNAIVPQVAAEFVKAFLEIE
jgi:DNA (cytosine-5)-methyltransferase 1